MKGHLAPDPPGCPRNESTLKPQNTILVNGYSVCRQNEVLACEQARSGSSRGVTTSQGRRQVRRQKEGREGASKRRRKGNKGENVPACDAKNTGKSSQLLVH